MSKRVSSEEYEKIKKENNLYKIMILLLVIISILLLLYKSAILKVVWNCTETICTKVHQKFTY